MSRIDALADRGLVAAAQRDSTRALYLSDVAAEDAARARVRAARGESEAVRATLLMQGTAADASGQVDLLAPSKGLIVRRFIESAGLVRAGQALFELGDPAALEVIAEVLTPDAARIAPGTPVRLLNWGGAQALTGRVRRIEPGGYTKVSALGVEEQRVLVVIDMDVAADTVKPGTLGDSFRVDVEFLVQRLDASAVLPTAALLRDGTQWAAYVIEDGRAKLQLVQLGVIGSGTAEVRSGMAAGTRVVLYPDDQIRSGLRVWAP